MGLGVGVGVGVGLGVGVVVGVGCGATPVVPLLRSLVLEVTSGPNNGICPPSSVLGSTVVLPLLLSPGSGSLLPSGFNISAVLSVLRFAIPPIGPPIAKPAANALSNLL